MLIFNTIIKFLQNVLKLHPGENLARFAICILTQL